MARAIEDVLEAEVRRRLTDALSHAGVDGGRIALEILYMLPEEFVRGYRELFDLALAWAPKSSAGSGVGKATGRDPKDPLSTRTIGVGSKTRRFAGSWAIRNEDAMEEKRKLDKMLTRLLGEAIAEVRVRAGATRESIGAARRKSDTSPGRQRTCERCGRGQIRGWRRCPFHREQE